MTESQSTPALSDRRKRRRVAIAAISAGVVALVVVLIIVLGGGTNKSVAQSTASTTRAVAVPTSTSAATTVPAVVVVSTTTIVSTTGSTTVTTVADTSVASTTTQAPTSSTVASTETPTTATRSTIAPVTEPPITAAPVTPVTSAAAVGNCTNVGSISIPATKTLQPILAETQQYSDGLLCGNHKSDHVEPGVDILPGFAPFAESVAGGPDLIGKVPAVIFGHRNSHNRPFYSIDKLQQGDAVSILNLDGSTIDLKVDTVVLMSLADATTMLLAPSTNGDSQLRLVACSHADGTPGGVNYRWIATLVKA